MFLSSRHSGYSRSCLYGLLLGCLLGLVGQVHAQDCEAGYTISNSVAMGHVCWKHSDESSYSHSDIDYYPFPKDSGYTQQVPKAFLFRHKNCPTPYNIHLTVGGKEVCMKYVMHHKEKGFICQTFEPDGLTVIDCESLILDSSQ